jgi:hypothetical protein
MEMPGAVAWLLPIVVGESWPEGDEDKLRALRDAWHVAAKSIGPVAEIGTKGAGDVTANWTGDSATAFAEQWKNFTDGDEAYFKSLTDAAQALGDSCDQTALDVEYTKYMIIVSLVILAAQIVAMIAAAAPTFGASTSGIAPAQIATRMTVQMLFRQLLEKLAQQGFKQLAKELLEKFLKEGLKKIAKEIVENVAINVAMDAGIQGLQMAKGDRKSWDWDKTKDGAIGGAVDGVVSAASGGLSKKMRGEEGFSFGGKVVQSATEGVASTVGQAAVTGDLGNLSAKDILTGASSGAVSGGVDVVKSHYTSVNSPHVDAPDGPTPDSSSPTPDSEPSNRPDNSPSPDPEPSPSQVRSEPDTPSSSPTPNSAPERPASSDRVTQQSAQVAEPLAANEQPAQARPEPAAVSQQGAPQQAQSAPTQSAPRASLPPQSSPAPTHSSAAPAAGGPSPTRAPSSGGYGMAPPPPPSHGGFGPTPGPNPGAPQNFVPRPQDNVSAAGFTGGMGPRPDLPPAPRQDLPPSGPSPTNQGGYAQPPQAPGGGPMPPRPGGGPMPPRQGPPPSWQPGPQDPRRGNYFQQNPQGAPGPQRPGPAQSPRPPQGPPGQYGPVGYPPQALGPGQRPQGPPPGRPPMPPPGQRPIPPGFDPHRQQPGPMPPQGPVPRAFNEPVREQPQHQPAPEHEPVRHEEAPAPAREHVPDGGEGYLSDPAHRGTPEDHDSVRRAMGNDENYQRLRETALARRDANPALAHLSDDNATAIHGYSRELAYPINSAHRIGETDPNFAAAQHQNRAIDGALNELPPQVGPLVRGLNFNGDSRLADLGADHYVPGQVTIEPTLTSASMKLDEHQKFKFGDDVVLHIDSKTSRDISSLAENPSEHEALSKAGTQLFVHDKRLEIGPNGERKWVIHAEEVTPGDPRHLDPDTARQKIAERRERFAAEAEEVKQRSKSRIADIFGGLTETAEPAPQRSTIADRLDGGYGHDGEHVPANSPAEHANTGENDWSPLARATNPPSEPAIHAGTANSQQQADYVAQRHPELAAVNPHFHDPDAFANGYQTNCTRGVVAYAQRLLGINAHAEPLLPHEMATRGTLEHVQQQLGGEWRSHSDYDSVIRAMNDEPIGSHAVVGVLYEGPNGQTYGHVAMAVHTDEGVAFIDPQSGSLMHLPHPPLKLDLLPFGSLKDSEGAAAPHGHTAPEQTVAEPHHGHQAQPSTIPTPEPEHSYGMADPTREEIASYLADPKVDEALDRANQPGADGKVPLVDGVPLGDAVRQLLPEHPELVRTMQSAGYLENSLLARPQTMVSLMRHPEAIPILADAVDEVNHPREDATPLAPAAEPTPLTAEQNETTHSVRDEAATYPKDDQIQAPYDMSRAGEEGYRTEYMAERYREAAVAQAQLTGIADELAAENGGEAHSRPKPKDLGRANDKIDDNYDGDASKLIDLAGSYIQFDRVQDAYAALAVLAADPRLEIVRFDDRFANPEPSGYRDLQMNVRMSNGHIAELRLHLRALDEIAVYEHALYEVRRDFKAGAKTEGRALTPEEAALRDGLIARERALFWTALQGGL